MASKVLQYRGGTTTEHATFVGADREVTVDTTKKTLVVHDGATVGGTPLAKASDITAINTTLASKQPIDADLTAIAGLVGTTGILKKTDANTWVLDTTLYAPNTHVGTTGTAHGNATTAVAGFMSNTDKVKLDAIATGANNYVHPISGVTAGIYKSVTVDANGHITAGTNPTTIAGYGITDAYSKTELDGLMQGLKAKASVVAATTANITLSGVQTIDGIAVIAGDRVLVKNQTTGATNGIYVVNAAAWTRSADANTANEITSAYVFVEKGTVNADTGWVMSTDAVTLGTTALTFIKFTNGNYILPTATAAVLGGVKVSATAQTVAANAVSATAAKTYVVQLDASNIAVVNVPWVDTNTITTVENVLTSTSPTNALSAAQGKVLADTKISKVTSTDNAIVRFNGTTGDVQNSSVTIDDVGAITASKLDLANGVYGSNSTLAAFGLTSTVTVNNEPLTRNTTSRSLYAYTRDNTILKSGNTFNKAIVGGLIYTDCNGGASGGSTGIMDLYGFQVTSIANNTSGGDESNIRNHFGLHINALAIVDKTTGANNITGAQIGIYVITGGNSTTVNAGYINKIIGLQIDSREHVLGGGDIPLYGIYQTSPNACNLFKGRLAVGTEFIMDNANAGNGYGASIRPHSIKVFNQNISTNQIDIVDITPSGIMFSMPEGVLRKSPSPFLDYFREGSITLGSTGLSTNVTGNANFSRIGRTVTITLPTISGTSNAPSFSLTGLPAEIRPNANRYILTQVTDNGTPYIEEAYVTTAGAIVFNRGFTATGTKSCTAINITYII